MIPAFLSIIIKNTIMDIQITPRKLKGTIRAVDSKSHAHRLLIATAMAGAETAIAGTDIPCAEMAAGDTAGLFSELSDGMINDPSEDLAATAACMKTLLSCMQPSCREDLPAEPDMVPRFECGESGSTLRFLLPLSVAAGRGGVFYGGGKLPERPLAPLDEELAKHGAVIERPGRSLDQEYEQRYDQGHDQGHIETKESTKPESNAANAMQKICKVTLPEGESLRGGEYEMPGHISSQYITGLLMALPLIPEDSVIRVTTPLQSRAYVDITLAVLKEFGIDVNVTGGECPIYHINGGQKYSFPDAASPGASSPDAVAPEGDWSNGAFWLVADALGSDITVTNLRKDSPQGDIAIQAVIGSWEEAYSIDKTIDASEIPDLVPIISVLAALKPTFTRIVNAGRLRIKESDRLKTTCDMLSCLGADIIETDDGLEITGKGELRGGTVDGAGDHRIVMAAAIAATCCREPVTIIGAEAAAKSYPRFFEDYEMLGGSFEIL